MSKSNQKYRLSIIVFSFLLGLEGLFALKVQAKDTELKVGIIQRFGDKPTEEVTVASTNKDLLTLSFLGKNSQKQTLKTDRVKLEIAMETLSDQTVEEKLVLSNHGTFETAEDSAQQWKAKGIEVEITQPDRWQVWAKRDVYSTPLLRRWLLASLQAKGDNLAYLDTKISSQKPILSFKINGKNYQGDRLEINTSKNLVQITETKNGHSRDRSLDLYAGSLTVQPNAYGDFTVVNQVPLESYLRGVVPFEIGADAPFVAMQAQTIIARTYALRNLRRFSADNYQLCASVHCQVYKGLSGVNSRIDRAIATTKSLVLTYDRELVDALYYSTNGGITAYYSDIWNGEERPYLKAFIDSPKVAKSYSPQSLASEANFRRFINLKNGFSETGTRVFRWQKKSSLQEIAKDLQEYLQRKNHPLADFQTIESMQIIKRSPSGRILAMQIKTNRGAIKLEKNEVRGAISDLRSTLFYLKPIYDPQQKDVLVGYQFIGGGFGHGVGLSQFGAHYLAKLGWSVQQILQFYYPGTTIQPLNNSIIFWQESSSLATPPSQNNSQDKI